VIRTLGTFPRKITDSSFEKSLEKILRRVYRRPILPRFSNVNIGSVFLTWRHTGENLTQPRRLRSGHEKGLPRSVMYENAEIQCQSIHHHWLRCTPQSNAAGPEVSFNIHRSKPDHRVRGKRLRLPSYLQIENASLLYLAVLVHRSRGVSDLASGDPGV